MKNPVHCDDLMKGFLAIANNPKAYGKTYPFCGSEEISIRDLAKLMLKHQGISKPFVSIPISVCMLIAGIMDKCMKRPPLTWNGIAGISQEANPDWRECREDFGYEPVGIHDGMDRSFPIQENKSTKKKKIHHNAVHV
jgi:nucleoside-diphosphate-sugar epimerase